MGAARQGIERLREERLRQLQIARRRERWAATMGLAVLVLAIAFVATSADGLWPWHWTISLAGAILAIALSIGFRERCTRQRKRLETAVEFHDHRLLRLQDQWPVRPRSQRVMAPVDHPFAQDLDVVGPLSLFARVDTTGTTLGRDALLRHLIDNQSDPTLEGERVRWLGDRPEFREALAVELASFLDRIGEGEAARELLDYQTRGLLGWGRETPPPPEPRPWIIRDVVATVVFLALFSLAAAQLIPWLWVGLAWFMNFFLLGRGGDLGPLLERFESVRTTLNGWAQLMELIERDLEPRGPLHSVVAPLLGPTPASRAVRELDAWVERLSYRKNPIWALTLNVAFLADFHIRRALHRWQRRHGPDLDAWLLAVAEMEAYSSLATYAEAHPDGIYPQFHSGPPGLQVEDLSHPLLPRATRVGTSLTVPRQGALVLITGSNMSGKSTFLRATGLAVVMGRAGLPVPARKAEFSLAAVTTSMRVQDDLAEGSSRFHAEVRRLSRCIQDAHDGSPALVLLDEILAGTNSFERHVGTESVLQDLAQTSAITMVATHDLALASLADRLPGQMQLFHFRDDVRNGVMAFDYILRPGVCSSTNALSVMRSAGLPVPPDETLSS